MSRCLQILLQLLSSNALQLLCAIILNLLLSPQATDVKSCGVRETIMAHIEVWVVGELK